MCGGASSFQICANTHETWLVMHSLAVQCRESAKRRQEPYQKETGNSQANLGVDFWVRSVDRRRSFCLAIINSSSYNYRENPSASDFDWAGGVSKTCFSRAILLLQFWFWPRSQSARVAFPCSRDLRAAFVAYERFPPKQDRSFWAYLTLSKCECNISSGFKTLPRKCEQVGFPVRCVGFFLSLSHVSPGSAKYLHIELWSALATRMFISLF